MRAACSSVKLRVKLHCNQTRRQDVHHKSHISRVGMDQRSGNSQETAKKVPRQCSHPALGSIAAGNSTQTCITGQTFNQIYFNH